MSVNYNKHITIRELAPKDFYDGMYIQSFGNIEYIYQVKIDNGERYHTPSHKIFNPCEAAPYIVRHSGNFTSTTNRSSRIFYCETIWTIQLNREKKLESIGI
jgi:hypothetical protein